MISDVPKSRSQGGLAALAEAEMMDLVDEAAARLRTAATERRACQPVRDLIGNDDLELAYAVQERLTRARVADGASVIGRKIGATSLAVQNQLGVDQPDFGVLFGDMDCSEEPVVAMSRLLQPKVEAEVAFVLSEDLDGGPFDADRVRSAVGYAVAAIEVVDSRIVGWDITFADTVADNASSGLFVLGRSRAGLDEFEPVATTMTMWVNDRVRSEGSGQDCLGDPLIALAWLAEKAHTFGEPLRAGQLILSGALGPMVDVTAGDAVEAHIAGLGSVTATFR